MGGDPRDPRRASQGSGESRSFAGFGRTPLRPPVTV